MSLCVLCGQPNPDDEILCSAHISTDEDWAVSNRIMCNFVHRGVVPPRVPTPGRSDLLILTGPEATEAALELVGDI
jgi:hypothetical protein